MIFRNSPVKLVLAGLIYAGMHCCQSLREIAPWPVVARLGSQPMLCYLAIDRILGYYS